MTPRVTTVARSTASWRLVSRDLSSYMLRAASNCAVRAEGFPRYYLGRLFAQASLGH